MNLNDILVWWKRRKLRKAKENLAYWTGVVSGFESIGSVYNYQRADFIDAKGKVAKYKARVESLENEN